MTMKFEDEDDYDEDIDEEEEEDLEEDEEEEEDDEKEEEDEDEDEEDIEQQPTSSWEVTNTSGNDGEYSLDLYNLASFNFHPLQIDADNLESELLHGTKLATQQIINRLFECPITPSECGPVAELPKEISKLPRAKRVPEPKQMTKWEKFAKQKGIKNNKRERMLYDEDTGEYKPRFGYKRGNNGIEDTPIVEVKDGQDPFADPWTEERKTKKERVQKNQTNQVKNQMRAAGKKPSKQLRPNAYDPAANPGLPLEIINSKKRGKEGVRSALQIAQQSTASMGRFDEMRQLEPERRLKGKKRSFRDNFGNSDLEKNAMKTQLRVVQDKVDKKKRGVTNSLAAYEGIIPDAPSNSFKMKRNKSKGDGGRGQESPVKKQGKKSSSPSAKKHRK